MNKCILCGRLVRDPELRRSGQTAVAKYTLAVDRRFKKENEPTSDFINCIEFGKQAEFAEKYFTKGMKLIVTGRIQTGSYTNKDGQKVYTTDVIVEDHEFAESKGGSSNTSAAAHTVSHSAPQGSGDGFMNIPDGLDEELPFN